MEGIIALLIPFGAFAVAGFAIWTGHQRKLIKMRGEFPATHDADAERMREEMKYLKQRVAVLEQITTDGHSTKQLENEIEQLRDR
ncbi:MAG: hypothetical protein GW808_11135 [Sphingomonadales bacterium]|nr:hypothetical protein [Sphingomonadales bacterium]PIX66806.1 MAG: hypothetical protein COZ43_04740 [Sphingomonadales bacterium CG_4_10_14_3_um_filter_58_15]NCO48620.1 hypothetical protein [Sphingomonadales bacterium]NCO98728.1 hypothetical protein [Sphingomonadales bacterium]NCP28272.1 hypothetical protein [Sphingomonadales bacterium]